MPFSSLVHFQEDNINARHSWRQFLCHCIKKEKRDMEVTAWWFPLCQEQMASPVLSHKDRDISCMKWHWKAREFVGEGRESHLLLSTGLLFHYYDYFHSVYGLQWQNDYSSKDRNSIFLKFADINCFNLSPEDGAIGHHMPKQLDTKTVFPLYHQFLS